MLLLVLVPAIAAAASGSRLGRPQGRAPRGFSDKLREGPGVVNHPVHVRPSDAVAIPAGWPLDVDGSITCLTCHASLPTLDGSSRPKLRRGTSGDGESFCINCHGQRGIGGRGGSHWNAVQHAHPGASNEGSNQRGGTLDAESQRCLGCHDGVNAVDAVNHAGQFGNTVSVFNRNREHPIGVDYIAAARTRSDAALRSPSQLPHSVRLPGGKVSCVSCHDVYSHQPHLLSAPIEGSRLCFTCHEFD